MTQTTQAGDAVLIPEVLEHYRLAGPLIEAQFGGTPIVYADFPHGFEQAAIYRVTDVPLSQRALLWCVQRFFAIEFFSWAPLRSDETRLRFARILLEYGGAFARVKEAALALRDVLAEAGMRAIPLADGTNGIALWIPLDDAPDAAAVRRWLHGIVALAVAKHPTLISGEVNTHHDGRVHAHVSSNARGRYSAVPYSLRGGSELPVCVPVTWGELPDLSATACTAKAFPAWLKAHGDLFAVQMRAIGRQTLGAAPDIMAANAHTGHTPGPRGHIITAAIDILNDGKARTADEICDEAIARGLVPKTTTRKYVYSALIEYIARSMGRGRKPPIVQDEQRRFRINEPADDWPDIISLPQRQPDAAALALCERLEATASGDDPAAFEIAVCDAFAHVGFLTQHIGGEGQPDGVADAILGPLGYRVSLECKSAKGIVTQPDCAEAARGVAELQADYGVLAGPAFSDETELLSELQVHKITALTVADIQTLLHIGANAIEVRRVLVPGYASDVLGDVLWARAHGEIKRVATVAALVAQEGWKAQRTAAAQGGRVNAPHLNVDSAMLMVDQALSDAGSKIACTRDEVEAALAYLASPIADAAIRAEDGSIVLLGPGAITVPAL